MVQWHTQTNYIRKLKMQIIEKVVNFYNFSKTKISIIMLTYKLNNI